MGNRLSQGKTTRQSDQTSRRRKAETSPPTRSTQESWRRGGQRSGPKGSGETGGQGGRAEHPRREPDEVPNAEGEFRVVPGVLPPIPEPRDRRHRKETCPSPP